MSGRGQRSTTKVVVDCFTDPVHLGQEGVSGLEGRLSRPQRWVVGPDDRVLGDDHGQLGGLELSLGRSGEVGIAILLLGRDASGGSSLGVSLGRGRTAASTDQLLSLGGVVTHVLLSDLSVLSCGLLGSITELGGLGVDDVAGLAEVLVDELLVLLIYERGEEEDGGEDQGQSPVGDDLDEIVGDEGSDGSLGSVSFAQGTP